MKALVLGPHLPAPGSFGLLIILFFNWKSLTAFLVIDKYRPVESMLIGKNPNFLIDLVELQRLDQSFHILNLS